MKNEVKQMKVEDYIEIIKGHDTGGCFCIKPVKYAPNLKPAKDYCDDWKEYKDYEISIDETDVGSYLLYFLLKHFDANSKANKTRTPEWDFGDGFEYYSEHNFYTYNEVNQIISDIKILLEIIDGSSSKEDCIAKIQKRFPLLEKPHYYPIDIAKNVTDGFHSVDAIADFYRRFIEELTNMMASCKECDIITFIGP